MRERKVLVYSNNTEEFKALKWPENVSLYFANPKYFGVPQAGYPEFWSNNDKIISAHEAMGITLVDLPGAKKKAPAAVSVNTQEKDPEQEVSEVVKEEPEAPVEAVEEEVVYETVYATPPEEAPQESPEEASEDFPTDWRDLSWPKLRGLAAKYSDGAVRNKEEAVAVMEEAEKQQ